MKRSELVQLLNLSDEFIAPGRMNRPGTPLSAATVTIPNTDNKERTATATNQSKFLRNVGYYELTFGVKKRVSWHFSVDDRQTIPQLPLDEVAWHAKEGNASSIAVEVCMFAGIDQKTADLRAARLAALLLYDMGKDVDQLRTHKSWTGKECPSLLLPKWDKFVQAVSSIRGSITSDEFVHDLLHCDDLVFSASRSAVQDVDIALEDLHLGSSMPATMHSSGWQLPLVGYAAADLDLAGFAKTGAAELQMRFPNIVFTSGRRTVRQQSKAMAQNVARKRTWIRETYKSSAERDALQAWVDANPTSTSLTDIAKGLYDILLAWTDAQRSSYSKHFAGLAFDVEPVADDAQKVIDAIRALPKCTKFLDSEGGLKIWHAEFSG